MVSQPLAIQHSWVYALAGVVSILFGIVAVLWPGVTLAVLVILFGVFAIVDGIVSLVNMFVCIGEHRTWWPSLVFGIIGLAAGAFVLAYPGISTVTFAFVVAFWALATGLMLIVGSLFAARFLGVLTGVLSIVFGLLVLNNPVAGILTLVLVIGIFAVVRGVMLLIDAFRAPELGGMAM
jgi:uncharacterized membrane protein HdeD (DUF308 family)